MWLVLLFLPLYVYTVLAWRHITRDRGTPTGAAWGSVAACVLSGIAAVWMIDSGGRHYATEIAWTGIESDRPEAPLIVGGAKQDVTAGWPNGNFLPRIEAASASNRTFRLAVSGGAGFLLRGNEALTGKPVDDGAELASGDFRISWRRRLLFQRFADIRDASSEVLASFRLPVGRDKVIPLAAAITRDVVELRQKGRAEEARKLEEWAASRWLLARPRESYWNLAGHYIWNARAGPAHTPRLLIASDIDSATVAGGETLSVLWPSRSQHFSLSLIDGRVAANFRAPWTHNSPPPPNSDNRIVPLWVTAIARPGDLAFTLPFGGGMGDYRRQLFFFRNQFVQRQEGGQSGASPYAPRRDRPSVGREQIHSEQILDAGPYLIRLTSLSDTPTRWWLLAVVLLGGLTLAAAYSLELLPSPPAQPWFVMGLVTSFVSLLTLRFALAMRYALNPATIDRHACSGVEASAAALAWAPGALLLLVFGLRIDRRHSEDDRMQQRRRVFFHSIALICANYGALGIVRALWPNLPDRFFPGYSFWFSWWGLGTSVLLAVAIAIFLIVYFRARSPELARRSQLRGIDVPFGFFQRIAPAAAERIWRTVAVAREAGVRRPPEEEDRTRQFRTGLIALAAALIAAYALLYAVHYFVTPSIKVLPEVVMPLLFFWLPAALLLGSRLVWGPEGSRASFLQPHDRFSVPRALLIMLVIFGAVFALPVALHDAGGMVAAAAVFLATIMVLFAGGRSAHVPLLALALLMTGFVAAAFLYLNVDPLAPTPGAVGEARVRLLVYKDPVGLQGGLAWFSLRDDDETGIISAGKIGNAIEHTWENQAIAHEGGWFGLGFGNAPTRRSLVRQDTIQYDSTYTFYIASEHGIVGGLALLLAYGCLLAITIAATRRTFGLGQALGVAITCALFLEAAFHILMNLGSLPFTGRDLPLLAVKSWSDLGRWFLLLALVFSASSWSINSTRVGPEVPSTGPAPRRRVAPEDRTPSTRSAWRRAVAVICLLPLLASVWIVFRGAQIARRHSVARMFDWSPLLADVNAAAARGDLRYHPKSHTIEFDKPESFKGTTLLEQEVARFNALSPEEKLEGLLAHHPRGYLEQLARVRSVRDWDDLMKSLRDAEGRQAHSPRPSLLRLTRAGRAVTSEEGEAGNDRANSIPPVDIKGSDRRLPDLDEPLQVRANPDYNTRVTFVTPPGPADIATVRWTGARSGSWALRGDAFEIVLPVGAPGERNVTLARSGSSWRVAGVQGPPESGTAHLWLQGPASDGKRTQALHAGAFRATRDGIAFRAADASGRKLGSWLFWKDRFKAGASVSLAEAERMKLWFDKSEDVETEITAATAAQAALVGPAWVRGEWTGAFDPDRRIPWVRYLADAVRTEYRRLGRSEADRRYGSISLDAELQTAAQDFVAKKARALHHHRVAGRRRAHLRLPPRAALAVIRIPGGETLALGGWPRMNSSASWRQDASTGEWIPPVTWIESSAPASIRAHFGSDRNFARMLMGSATKPLWASVVLGIHPQLDRKLAVRGAGGVETEVFGIPITAKEWQVQGSRNIRDGANWCDFHSYLAASDNRYQVRLGFLGLAEAGVDGLPAAYEGTVSPSYAESLDGGKNPWRRYPRFAVQCKFNHKNSNLIGGLAETAVADRWARVFASGVRAGDMQYRSSFWSGDEADDRRIAGAEVEGPTSGLDVISPEAPSLALDKVSHPRQYISLLLGGSTNMWSNVDFAGAFGTLVTGRPVVPHITGAAVRPATTRITSEKEAARIRPGLTAVISHPSGTAYGAFRGVLPSLRRLGEVYGKTGTLRMSDNAEATVRMVVAIVRWSADRKQVRDGLVFSLVVERGGTGTAAEWLADFMAEQEPVLRRLMK